MFGPDHLSLKLLRLRPKEAWESPGKGFSFLFPVEGYGSYLLGPQAHLLNPGDVLVVNGEPRGSVCSQEHAEMALWVFSVSFEHLYPLFASRELVLLEAVYESLRQTKHFSASTPVARECHQLLAAAPPRLDFEHRMHLLRVAAAVMADEIKAANAQRGGNLRPDEHIVQVLERLSDKDLMNLSVDELARKFGFCRRHLNRLFHQYFGLSVSRLRMEMRMLKALTLLRNPHAKVVNVAEECGFNHLGLFNATFKQRFGTCPGQWRNQSRELAARPAASSLNQQLCALRAAGLCSVGEESQAPKPAFATTKGNGKSGAQRPLINGKKAASHRNARRAPA